MIAQWASYEINFGKGALERLYGEVPRGYFDCIQSGFQSLAADPTNRAERCNHPYPGAKAYQFECREGDHGFVFRVYFFFEPGETHIRVFDVTAINW